VSAPGAIVMGADYRGLGVVRSLGRRGVPVCVLRQPGENLAAVSRYAARKIARPDGDDDAQVAFLQGLGLDGWALFPTTDNDAGLVGRRHDELARTFTLTSPPWETVRWAYDKRLTFRLAEEAGIDQPRTAFDPHDPAIEFPAILKPAVKEGFNRLTVAKAWRVDSRAELFARWQEASSLVDPEILMVQELVPGGGETQFSYAALAVDGKPLAALTARRTRQYPADFGRASTYVETVDAPDLVEPSLRLLERIAFTGLVEVEFKRDPRDGRFKLLDVNPRVWGWHSLCGAAGVDFSWLLWRLVNGEEVPATAARAGVRWMRLTTDTPTALREVLRGRLGLGTYLRSLKRPRESAIFAADDPLPGLIEVPLLARLAIKRMAAGHGV
jgi:D-aspartate ligase